MTTHAADTKDAQYNERLTEAADSLKTNALDTARETVSGWAALPFSDWLCAVNRELLSQAPYFADQYRVDETDLLRAVHVARD